MKALAFSEAAVRLVSIAAYLCTRPIDNRCAKSIGNKPYGLIWPENKGVSAL